ncbi:MAG: PQQ-binding-like beta-propeller repeat protein [Acidobacteria bacterium]|nr:PQQ-binding-like beta-propeller repeat protein [Acidobacteriota bacterium]
MRPRWTTICCSLGAGILLAAAPLDARATQAPLALFPLRPLWTLPLGSRLAVAPAYDGTRAYYAIAGDRLAAYDLATGLRRWLVDAAPTLPMAAGGDLVFLVEETSLRALRAADGSTVWQVALAGALAAPPVWDNGWLIAATAAGDIVALRASDGVELWRSALGSAAHAPPALAADRVYVSLDDGRVAALQVQNGARLWDRRLGGPGSGILALDDRVYVGSEDNFFYCLRAGDGRIDWRWRTGADVIGPPLVDGNLVYFVSLDNMLRALHRTSGVQRWRAPLPARPLGGPVKAGGTLLVAGVGSSVPAYSLVDGRLVGELSSGGETAGPPYAFRLPPAALPAVVAIGRDIAAGATAIAVTRAIEPPETPIAPLPNVAMPSPPGRRAGEPDP